MIGPDGAAELIDDARASRAMLALRPGGRRCSAATSHDDERYAPCFAGGWYLSGDLATGDADGYFWFVGRGDDVIKTAGPPRRPVRGRERRSWSTRRWPRPP